MLTSLCIVAASLLAPNLTAEKTLLIEMPAVKVENASSTVYFSFFGEAEVTMRFNTEGLLTEVQAWTCR